MLRLLFVVLFAVMMSVCFAQEVKQPVAVAPIVTKQAPVVVVPDWLQRITFSGDFRIRYEYEKHEADTDARHRERMQLRLGCDIKTNDWVIVKTRLASGTDNRSRNQTFQDSFSPKTINIDEAYFDFVPTISVLDEFELMLGKFQAHKSLLQVGDMIWDYGITFEGQAVHVGKKVGPVMIFARSLTFVVTNWISLQVLTL